LSPLSLPTFFAAAKKVGAAPHRGNANKPQTNQGKANTLRKQTNKRRTGKNPNINSD
jgi:general secretion pathway protein K